MKKLFLLLVPAAMLLAGCMSLPSASSGQSVFVLPYKLVDKASGSVDFNLRFTYKSLSDGFENSFMITPSTSGYDVKVMKPGLYTITRVELIHSSTGLSVHDFKARLEFACDPGMITIAKSKYIMAFVRDPKFGFVTTVELNQSPLARSEREEISMKVKGLAGAEGWELVE